MKPLISIQPREPNRAYWPGEELIYDYQVDAVESSDITAIESSVLWYTEGKGEEDMSVHAFQRRVPTDVQDGDLRQLDTIRTTLPNSPFSYSGKIVKIRWCVRVRVFLTRNRTTTAEKVFQLGAVPTPALDEAAAP